MAERTKRRLEQIQRDHALPSTSGQGDDAPAPHAVEDEAARDGSPSAAPAPAPQAESAVQPAHSERAPGHPTYLDRVRAQLRAAGLG